MLWESISEGKAKAEGHANAVNSPYNLRSAKRTPVRLLLDQSLSITREDRSLAKRQGVCHGNAMVYHSELWDFIGIAMEGLSYAVANCLANCLRMLGLEPCRCYGKAMVYHSGAT